LIDLASGIIRTSEADFSKLYSPVRLDSIKAIRSAIEATRSLIDEVRIGSPDANDVKR